MRTMTKNAKRFAAVVAAASFLALGVMASQASAQDGPSIQIDPAAVAGPGSHTFTITGANWNPGLAIFIVPCTVPGEQLTTATPMSDLMSVAGAMTPANCQLTPLGTTSIGDDGTFTTEITHDVTANFAFGAGDIAQTQNAGFPVLFIAEDMMDDMDDMSDDMDDMGDDMSDEMDDMDDMSDDMVPDGGADTGFGGTAGSDSNSLAVPLAASIAAVTLLGAATLVARRNT